MEELIRTLLKADTDVVSHCGNRINFGSNPQGEIYPAIVLNTISETDGITLDGPDEFPESRLQLDCYANTYGAAKILSRDVRKLLHGYSDDPLQGVFYGTSRDGRDRTETGEALFRVSMDFFVRFNR